MSLLLYSVIFLKTSSSYVYNPIYLFSYFFLYAKENPTLEDSSYISNNNALTPTYPKNIQVTLSEENVPPQNHLSKLVNKNTLLNMNIALYSLNTLASPDVLTWFATGGPITKTIKHLGLKKSPEDIRKNVAYC